MNSAAKQLDNRMLADVLYGLSQFPKQISPKYFYDKRGSELFEEIAKLDEYYLTRSEVEILTCHAKSISAAIGKNAVLYELGSGSSAKTRILLRNLDAPTCYVPIDISGEFLAQTAHELKQEFPNLKIAPVCADFLEPIALGHYFPQSAQETPLAVFFPGSTIGNMSIFDARIFLANLSRALGPGGKLLVGVDRIKEVKTLELAYNDKKGITSEFNLNVLRRLNADLRSNFDIGKFKHLAFFCQDLKRIEMHLACTDSCEVVVGDSRISFQRGETIHTESSYKYDPQEFIKFVSLAGFQFEQQWTDRKEYFGVFLFQSTHSRG